MVDDELALRDAVQYALRAEGFDVSTVADGESALQALTGGSFDLVVLDVVLADLSGVEVCRRIRAERDVPILMLTARDTETDIVLGLEAGADDYMTKPFSMRELAGRVRALLRRRALDRARDERLVTVGDVTVDLLQHEIRIAGRAVHVTPTEFRLLELLASADRPFSRREILQYVWNTPVVPDERACDVHIANVRRRIEDDPARPQRLLTARGVGYRLARVKEPEENV